MVYLGPRSMVTETPPQALGMFDDRWWQLIVDFGLPGPDRGEGGPVPARPAGRTASRGCAVRS